MTKTKQDLIDYLTSKTTLSRSDISALVDQLMKTMFDNLVQGHSIKIPSFGTFQIREKAARPGRNPRTGEPVEVSERRVVVFKPSTVLKKNLREKS